MFCSSCGAQNPEGVAYCTSCGAQLAAVAQVPRPSNYLVWSIISTVLCCLPGGIAAIVYSSRVDSKFNAGDYAGAEEASRNAKTWNIVSMIVGFVAQSIYIGLMIAGVASGFGD